MRRKAYIRQQGGFLLIAALGFILFFSLLAFLLSQKVSTASKVQLLSALSSQALNAANSGIEEGAYQLLQQQDTVQQCRSINNQRVFEQAGLKQCQVKVHCSVAGIEGNLANDSGDLLYSIHSAASCGARNTYSRRNITLVLSLPIQDAQHESMRYRILYRRIE